MSRALIPCALAVVIAFSLMGGSPVEVPVTAAPLELRQNPIKQNPIKMSEDSVKAGRAAYGRTCRACHGLQGKGDGVAAPAGAKPANLVDDEWKYGSTDAEIFKTIKEGLPPYDVMKPWGKQYSDTDIWNIVNFLRDQAKRVKR